MKTSKPTDRLPWQRVIGKAGKNRGRIAIHDPVGAAVQRQLLDKEGVEIGDSGLIALDRYGWLPGDDRRTSRRRTARATAGSARAASPRRRPRSASTSRASSSRR
jgi:methylated-DNA-protein-cysteine methyltransferase-like protein